MTNGCSPRAAAAWPRRGTTAIYLAMALRNVGAGIAVLHGWRFYPRLLHGDDGSRTRRSSSRLTRDIYVPVDDVGFWQGAFRDPTRPSSRRPARRSRPAPTLTVDLLYGDHEGGQRVISRFALRPRGDDGWLAAAGRHWNIDRDDPR